MLFYGFINMAVTWITGTPIYAPLSWDSFWSWVMGLSLLPIAFGYYAGIYYLTKYKFRKLSMHDSIDYTVAEAGSVATTAPLGGSFNIGSGD